jgi:hypothetical protein
MGPLSPSVDDRTMDIDGASNGTTNSAGGGRRRDTTRGSARSGLRCARAAVTAGVMVLMVAGCGMSALDAERIDVMEHELVMRADVPGATFRSAEAMGTDLYSVPALYRQYRDLRPGAGRDVLNAYVELAHGDGWTFTVPPSCDQHGGWWIAAARRPQDDWVEFWSVSILDGGGPERPFVILEISVAGPGEMNGADGTPLPVLPLDRARCA